MKKTEFNYLMKKYQLAYEMVYLKSLIKDYEREHDDNLAFTFGDRLEKLSDKLAVGYGLTDSGGILCFIEDFFAKFPYDFDEEEMGMARERGRAAAQDYFDLKIRIKERM